MLDQIELLVHGVRNVSNSIAHDLRTPLAELRSRLEELALMRPPPRADIRGNRRGGRGRRPRDPHIQRAAAAGGNRCRHAPLRLRDARRGRAGRERRGILRACGGAEEHLDLDFRCGWPAAGLGRPGAARAGTEQLDRQRAQVRAGEWRDRGRGASSGADAARRSPCRTTARASAIGEEPKSSSASIAATRAAARRAWVSG